MLSWPLCGALQPLRVHTLGTDHCLSLPRHLLAASLCLFVQAAPQKKRGHVPFGVQHGTFLNTEERVRRRLAEWSATSPASLPESSGGAAQLSYKQLVESFQVCDCWVVKGGQGFAG